MPTTANDLFIKAKPAAVEAPLQPAETGKRRACLFPSLSASLLFGGSFLPFLCLQLSLSLSIFLYLSHSLCLLGGRPVYHSLATIPYAQLKLDKVIGDGAHGQVHLVK